jgi:hypothetical protein
MLQVAVFTVISPDLAYESSLLRSDNFVQGNWRRGTAFLVELYVLRRVEKKTPPVYNVAARFA